MVYHISQLVVNLLEIWYFYLYSSWVLLVIGCHNKVFLLCGSMEGAGINVEMNVIYGNDSWF